MVRLDPDEPSIKPHRLILTSFLETDSMITNERRVPAVSSRNPVERGYNTLHLKRQILENSGSRAGLFVCFYFPVRLRYESVREMCVFFSPLKAQ